ncbi:unnamed protein product [Protopolystoma xenopodis]|uniref:Band 7 domain-containing protein n=1 Tax=Protopolystoma xenopodis TaxID=117903 RepID=A0A448XEZ9_9PLAT|nr:unnamed protein product [Protopolystoma xenopodis]
MSTNDFRDVLDSLSKFGGYLINFDFKIWYRYWIVVAEYERAVIFRLGRILPGGARGPGLFLTLPCMDMIRKVDLRTVTFDVPPQEHQNL